MRALYTVTLCLLALSGGRAFSFAENVRHGYPSCTTCHVSAAGGGALTPYGRGAAEAFMATWASEFEAEPAYGYGGRLSQSVILGGDIRGVAVAMPARDGERPQRFYVPMQAQLELGVRTPSGLTLGVYGGRYGAEGLAEYRGFYAQTPVGSAVTIRAGRFQPAYGINLPDHTVATRQALGLGQGSEQLAVELAWLPPGGELIATGTFGGAGLLELDQPKRIGTLRTDDQVGGAIRGAVYIGASSVGLSGLSLSGWDGGYKRAVGPFAQLALGARMALLAEADRLWEPGDGPQDIAMAKLSWEAMQGLLAVVGAQAASRLYGGWAGVQWQPRPHWELGLELRAATADGLGGLARETAVGLLHYWL